ncbi:DUF3597 domain-containing protein [Rhizobium sp. S152]|uniref:DUF3597 domain-containing protein n=1 Tax=Rhizobium sp. S152 TaxID=3055038 RepID=UPI0025A9DDF4|nr:DUF3597 domain-containing protein [Rhizobium sp. S152]MDM9627728.1 DUF3597 domain-containing protein [Rhizobium sp. S152]
MSIFDRIKHAIFGEAHAASVQQSSAGGQAQSTGGATSPAQSAPSSPAASPAPTSAPSGSTAPSAGQMGSPTPSEDATTAALEPASQSSVDIEPILNDAVKKSGQKLDWRHSIVDLMKALGMDASLEERKELAQELGYAGDAHDSAKMNIFLHKALMKKLSENGGKVPADLID